MLREEVVLIASERMDGNKKEGRNENRLVRLPKKTRQSLSPKDVTVELYNCGKVGIDRATNSRLLKIHQAFSSDVKLLSGFIKKGLMTERDKRRVCFVSSDTFKFITKQQPKVRVARAWIADSIVDILIGADPEFILKDRSGTIIRGDRLLGRETLTAPLGIDNFGLQIEVRPEPEITPKKLIVGMRKILKTHRNAKTITDYIWHACSYNSFCVGGHLHFGTPKMLEEKKNEKLGFFVAATRILDELVAIPLSKIEGDGGVRRRGSTRFGRHGDFRKDTGRLEWRVPGGDWLAHPDLALAVVGASKAVCEEILYMIDASGFEENFIVPAKYRKGAWASYKGPANNQDSGGRTHFWTANFKYRTDDENDWADWPICESFGLRKSSAEVAQILHSAVVKKEHMELASKVLRNMSTYRDYKKEIDSFVNICSRTKKSLGTLNRNIKDTWLNKGKMFK